MQWFFITQIGQVSQLLKSFIENVLHEINNKILAMDTIELYHTIDVNHLYNFLRAQTINRYTIYYSLSEDIVFQM